MAKLFAAGPLKQRITIEQQATVQDPYGQPQASWTPVLNCWASVHSASSKEVYAAAGYVSQLSHIVTIRYTSVSITSAMRVRVGARVLQIQAVSDLDEAHVQLSLFCLERTT